MPTKRTRVIHQRKNISNTQLHYASDGLWGDPENLDKLEAFTYHYPTVRPDEYCAVGLRSGVNYCRSGSKLIPVPGQVGGISLILNVRVYQRRISSATVGTAGSLQ